MLFLPSRSFLARRSNLFSSSFQRLSTLSSPAGFPAIMVESQRTETRIPGLGLVGEVIMAWPVARPPMPYSSPIIEPSMARSNFSILTDRVSDLSGEMPPLRFSLWSLQEARNRDTFMSLPSRTMSSEERLHPSPW